MKKKQFQKLRKNSKYITEIKHLCKKNDIKCYIKFRSENSKYKGLHGFCSISEDKITLNIFNKTTPQIFVSSACHEISHILCKRYGKYKEYHSKKPLKKRTLKELKKLVRTSLKAEKYVDLTALALCSYLFPEITYFPTYWTEGGVRGHQNYYNNGIKKLIRRKQCQSYMQ